MDLKDQIILFIGKSFSTIFKEKNTIQFHLFINENFSVQTGPNCHPESRRNVYDIFYRKTFPIHLKKIIENGLILVLLNFTMYYSPDYKLSNTWDEVFKNGLSEWLYAIIMSCTSSRVKLHSIVAWMSRNPLLETGTISEV